MIGALSHVAAIAEQTANAAASTDMKAAPTTGVRSATKPRHRFLKKVVVITGASSGFGKGVALDLAAEGACVVLAARRADLLEKLATQCGENALACPTDVSKASDMQNLADAAVKRFGHVDVWINDAGVGAIGRFEDIPLEDHSRLIDVNLKGVIFGSHIAMKLFRAQGYGTLVNVGSIVSEVPMAYLASYAASKAGVLSLGRALNQELRLSGAKRIKVTTVMPFATDTPWWSHAANYSGGTPRMAAMDDPKKVVKTIVTACLRPKPEYVVGWKAKAAFTAHKSFPDTTERAAADIIHKWQFDTAPAAPATSGTLFEPMPSGTEVEGGVRERMQKENAQRKHSR
jgi:short-subunit dehydrogenase